MEFRFGGTRIEITFGFFAVLGAYMLFDRTGLGIPALCAIAAHESGHILMLWLTGARIAFLRFEPFGVRLGRRGLISYGREAAVYLGGVAANALCLLISVPLFGFNLFAAVNASLILFNLLPVGRLDGGQLLRVLLLRFGNAAHGEMLQKWLGFFVLVPLFAAALLLARQGNYTLLLTVGYLAATLWR